MDDDQKNPTITNDATTFPQESFTGNRGRIEDRKVKKQKKVKVNLEVTQNRETLHREQSSISEIRINTRKNSLTSIGSINIQDDQSQNKRNSRRRSSVFIRLKEWLNTRQRLLLKFEKKASSKNKCCCCVCFRMAQGELTEKNLMIGLCCRTSSLYSRCTRLSILMLGILTDVSICALFFNIDPAESESFYFWENLQQNIWVGLFSALISIPPVLLVVLFFSFPSKLHKLFQSTTSLLQLKKLYRKNWCRLNCKKCCGYFFFYLVSAFLCLYLLAFGHIVTTSLTKNWAQSSGASLAIDLIVFQVTPALIIGILGILIFSCKCKCCVCTLVSIDFYRTFRNIAA